MSDLEAIRSELARPVSRETVDKLVDALRFVTATTLNGHDIDPVVDHWSHTTDLACPRCLIDAAMRAYESETKR